MEHRPLPPVRIRFAICALLTSTCICLGIFAARKIGWGEGKFFFLPWNLLLAWIPLLAALRFHSLRSQGRGGFWVLAACAAVWFFFYPNAPYIVTDLVHLKTREPVPRWYDLLLIMSFAWTGLFLGYLSLYLMQEAVRNWRGRTAGWIFAMGMLTLASFGVYVGRFWRWNSWEVATQPHQLMGDALRRFRDMQDAELFAFCATFLAFTVAIYITCYTLTHLHGPVDALTKRDWRKQVALRVGLR